MSCFSKSSDTLAPKEDSSEMLFLLLKLNLTELLIKKDTYFHLCLSIQIQLQSWPNSELVVGSDDLERSLQTKLFKFL